MMESSRQLRRKPSEGERAWFLKEESELRKKWSLLGKICEMANWLA
jgi:hypothetical protein